MNVLEAALLSGDLVIKGTFLHSEPQCMAVIRHRCRSAPASVHRLDKVCDTKDRGWAKWTVSVASTRTQCEVIANENDALVSSESLSEQSHVVVTDVRQEVPLLEQVLRSECKFLNIITCNMRSYNSERTRWHRFGVSATLVLVIGGLPRRRRSRWQYSLTRAICAVLRTAGCLPVLIQDTLLVPTYLKSGPMVRLDLVPTDGAAAE